jgi:hypothetical protein
MTSPSRVRPEYPAGDEMQLVGFALDHHGVPGVVPAVVPDHEIRIAGQIVNDLAFRFVAPLRSYNHGICHLGARPSARS